MSPTAQALYTVADALGEATRRLREAGVEGPRRDAALLLAGATRRPRTWLMAHPEASLRPEDQAAFDGMVRRRAAREPVSRILGRREFWSLEFAVTAETLDPRPETETLVEAVAARLAGRPRPLRILDLGTGSGCILLALLTELPRAEGLGVDISEGALEAARANAGALGLQRRAAFEAGDWGRQVGGAWQAIVSNPPYIVNAEIPDLAPEVADYDPPRALSGGADGLDAYRALLPEAARLLAPGGLLALELGRGQFDAVGRLAEDAGFDVQDCVMDLSGQPRCLIAAPASMA